MPPKTLSGAALLAAITLAACGGGDRPADGAASARGTTAAPARPVALGNEETPSGRTILIQMVTDERGNRFEPDTVRAHAHDVLRFTLATGVHHVSFLPATGTRGVPAPPGLLQHPGESRDYVVGLAPGAYTFQCDPHAALGMVGTLIVE
jgi:plastocyanin